MVRQDLERRSARPLKEEIARAPALAMFLFERADRHARQANQSRRSFSLDQSR